MLNQRIAILLKGKLVRGMCVNVIQLEGWILVGIYLFYWLPNFCDPFQSSGNTLPHHSYWEEKPTSSCITGNPE